MYKNDLFTKSGSGQPQGKHSKNRPSTTVFSQLETTNKQTGKSAVGKLSLIDLAGSERAGKTVRSEVTLPYSFLSAFPMFVRACLGKMRHFYI